jgi:hypothetical protein
MPNVQEMMADPVALAEGRMAASKIRPEHLSELARAQKQEAERATAQLRSKWQDYWRLWQNEVDFSSKEEWQTQLWVPKVFSATEQATALIQRSLLETPDAFGIDGFDVRDKQLATHLWGPLLKLFLNNADLIYKFSDVCKVGFITGVAGYLKMRPIAVSVPRLMSAQQDPFSGKVLPQFSHSNRTFISIDLVLPWNIFRDPDSSPRQNYSGTYLYHSEWKDRGALKQMVQFGWDEKALNELLAAPDRGEYNTYASDRQREFANKQMSFERHKFRKSYLIDECWLDVLDENGDVVFPNALMVHSGGKILYGPVDNPIWATDLNTGRRKWPFVAGSPIVHPARFEGRGIVEQDASLSALYSNVFMLWADGLNWLVNPPTEVHQDALVDWEDLEHYPGKLWVKHSSEAALTPAQMGKMNTNEIMAALEYIDRTRQNSNFVTDFAIGLPGSRSDITKGEVQIKTSQSLAIFEAMGKNLEQVGREAVELAYNIILQFFDEYNDPQIGRILGPDAQFFLSNLPLEQRIESLQGNYDFVFTGVTQALQKADQLQKVVQFATLAASPGYQGYTNPSQVMQVLAELLGINDRIEVAEEQMVPMQQVQQLMLQMQAGGGSPGAPGQEPGGPSTSPQTGPPQVPPQGPGPQGPPPQTDRPQGV